MLLRKVAEHERTVRSLETVLLTLGQKLMKKQKRHPVRRMLMRIGSAIRKHTSATNTGITNPGHT